MDTIARVRRAFYVQGWSMKKIVRELHVSRNTVRKILRTDETDFSYERERQPMPRIGPWQGQLEQFLSSNANKPARERLTLIRIFEELRGLGYEGGYDAVRRFAKGWSQNRGAVTAEAYVPLYYAPGEAYQFDWSHEVVVISGVTVTVTGRLVPDHKTIADFRRDNGTGIRKVCAQFVELCRRIGTLKGDCVAIDGSKFKAVNNRDRNFTKGKIASRITHLEADVERYITEMIRIDRQEEGEARAGKVEHLSRRYGRIRQEIARLKEMDQALADVPDGQISLTDPDARSMATSARHSGMVGYNVQSAVDTETHLIVVHEVTNQGFDREQLSPMATAAKEALGREDLHAIADKGYFSSPEILACHEAGITTTVPRPATSGNAAKGMYVKADFVYEAGRDVYVCPAGEELTYRYTTEERSIQIRRYWINGCKTCPLQTNCTTGNERRISRWEREDLVDEMDNRLGRDPDYMTLRRCTVEHPFGTIKAWMGSTHFLTRRLTNVRSEMALNVLAYNIKRMVALLGVGRLMRAMQG